MPLSGRPSTSTTDDNIKKVKEIVLENRHAGVKEIARKLSIARSRYYAIRYGMWIINILIDIKLF